MLTILKGNVTIPLKIDDYYVRELSSGLDELIFEMSIRDVDYQHIQEEGAVQDRDKNRYLIKQVDAGNETAKIIAQIDVNDWKSKLWEKYNSGSNTPYGIINNVKPSGWIVYDQAGITTRKTIPTSDTAQPYSVTALEIVDAVCNRWNLRVRYDTSLKRITIVNPASYQPFGAFATRELNLKSLNYKGKSQGFITRLYCQGKDGLTFASINDGKNYVENHDYSDAVICGFWKDERYTDKQSLYDDAVMRLKSMARPQVSYDCEVYDLAKTNPDKYGIQDFSLFAVITLMDDAKKTAIEHQVVERWDYPHYPNKNRAILATSVPKLQNQVQSVVSAVETPTSTFQQMIQAVIDSQTGMITGNSGGYVVLHDSNGDGMPDEILIMDAPDIATATKLWRWNAAGLGYSSTGYNGTYTTAWTMDGSFSADFITSGTLSADIIQSGSLNAALVDVINLVADTVLSVSEDGKSRTGIAGGTLSYEYSSNPSMVAFAAIMFLRTLTISGSWGTGTGAELLLEARKDNGTLGTASLLSPNSGMFGVPRDSGAIAFSDCTGSVGAGTLYANTNLYVGGARYAPTTVIIDGTTYTILARQ